MKAIVVGNGVSLQQHLERGDFELLKDVATIAMNQICLIYPDTDWRPTHYVYMEWLQKEDGNTLLHPMEYVVPNHIETREDCYINKRFYEEFNIKLGGHHNDDRLWDLDNIQWITIPGCHNENIMGVDRAESWHLPTFCLYGGTMNIAIQHAFMMGYEPVGVIGADLGFKKPVEGEPDPNHFHPNYITQDDFPLEFRDSTLRHMHSFVRKEFEQKGRRIYNVGIDGHLEIYDRMLLKEFLNAKT